MPSLALHPCAAPQCGRLLPAGEPRCIEHARQQDRARGKTAERGYDADHRRLREAKLAIDPFCQIRTHCDGAIATEIDHIIAIAVKPELRLEWSNVQSACKACNVAKRNRENARKIA